MWTHTIKLWEILAVFWLSTLPFRSFATYSIVAVDTATGELGSAAVSCTANTLWNLDEIPVLVPNVGIAHVQGLTSNSIKKRIRAGLEAGDSVDQIVKKISANPDPMRQLRQFTILKMDGSAGGFSGNSRSIRNKCSNKQFPEHRFGASIDRIYAVAGNTLTCTDVLDRVEEGFRSTRACDFADSLILALERGAENNGGDHRCVGKEGNAGTQGFLRVFKKTKSTKPETLIDLSYRCEQKRNLLFVVINSAQYTFPTAGGCKGAPEVLRKQFNIWRDTHPCPRDGDQGDSPQTKN